MRILGLLLLACIVLAALKAAIMALVIVCGLTLLVGLITRPFEVLAWMAGFVLLGMAQSHPLAGLIVIGLLVFASASARRS